MPVIDLDQQAQVASGRAPRQRSRILFTLTAGLLLLGLTGEPGDSLSPHDKATFCPLVALAVGASIAQPPGASSTRVTIMDADTGKVARIIYCPAG